MPVRTRFAPSPTGFLHIGGARTALFNSLYARHHGGQFILRIEDTDRERSTPEAVEAILESLRWLRLDWDEGPFFQSQRAGIYRQHAEQLAARRRAYWCACTPAVLEQKRRAALARGRSPAYDRTCRAAGLAAGAGRVLRFKAPAGGQTAFADLVKGPIVFENRDLDDFVLLRSDGTPTYNFCVVVDDALMGVTHLIRGEDHIPNTPRQILLYEAWGYPAPAFAHVPLILGMDRTRLSKRHGATSVTAYRDAGYLPEAVVNYLVRLGWSYGDQELFGCAELIEKFSLEGVGTSAGVFNPEKMRWVNFNHLKRLSAAELAAAARPFIAARGYAVPGDETWLQRVVKTMQERAGTLVELVESSHFYFSDAIAIDPKAAAKHWKPASVELVSSLRDCLAGQTEWSEAALHGVFEEVMRRFGVGLGKLAQPVRVAVTGGAASPGIFVVLALLGKRRVMERIDKALALFGGQGAEGESRAPE